MKRTSSDTEVWQINTNTTPPTKQMVVKTNRTWFLHVHRNRCGHQNTELKTERHVIGQHVQHKHNYITNGAISSTNISQYCLTINNGQTKRWTKEKGTIMQTIVCTTLNKYMYKIVPKKMINTNPVKTGRVIIISSFPTVGRYWLSKL